MTRLTASEIRAIARALAAELRSGASSGPGIGASGQGDDQCRNENVESESMDPTSIEIDGESSSSEQTAHKLLLRSRTKPRRNVLPMPRARSQRGAR